MVQNGTIVSRVILNAPRATSARGSRPRDLVAGFWLIGALSIVALPARPDAQPSVPGPARQMSATYRQAVAQLERSEASSATTAVRRAALHELAESLDGMAAPPVASPAREQLATDLRRAAAALREVSAGEERPGEDIGAARRERRVDAASLRALLDRVRVAVEGEVALGLSFQGSYSQARVREPVYGGHASAMGPAPAAPPTPVAGAGGPSPVTFHERAQLPTRTWNGGPTKTTSSSRPATAWRSSTWTAMAGSTSTWSRPRSSTPPAGAFPTATLCTATSATGSSRTSPRRRASMPPPGATACARATPTATDAWTSTSPTGDRTSFSATRVTDASRRSRRRLAWPPEAGAPGARSSTPTPMATWTSTSRATCRRRGTTSCARSARSGGATARPSWSARQDCPVRPTCSSRISAADALPTPRPRAASPTPPARTASAWSPPMWTTMAPSTCSWPTTPIRTSCTGMTVRGASRAWA